MDTKTVNTFKKDTFKKDWGWKDVVRSFKKKPQKTALSCKTVKSKVTQAITLSNVMRSADIIMLLLPHTETPNPHKPSRCSETEAQTVKQNNLFPLSLQPVWHGPNSANNSSAIWVCAIQSLCQHKALSYRQPCNSHCNNCSLHWHGF